MKTILALLAISLLVCCQRSTEDPLLRAEKQLEGLRKEALKEKALPRSLNPGKTGIRWSRDHLDWTEGFFPGTCWMIYQYSGYKKWKQSAIELQKLFENHKDDRSTHDLGFIFNNSYGKAFRITDDPHYRQVLLDAAGSLLSRYNDTIGCIKSWDWAPDRWIFPVIIDNMMNLELLFEAFKLTGDSTYYVVAVNHANTTLKNHFRPDNSSYHVVNYALDGSVISKETQQGYSDSSAWSRGQAWGLYGYTMSYRYTRDTAYLLQAEKIADFLIRSLPADLILPWDLDAPDSLKIQKDASASAIMASALIELSSYSANEYRKTADRIIHQLCQPDYFAQRGENHNFLLKHGVGSFPEHSEVDVPLVYGDYYLVEALLRQEGIKNEQLKINNEQ